MNCIPGFADGIWFILLWSVSAGQLYLVGKFDTDFRHCRKKWLFMVWIASCTVITILGYGEVRGRPAAEKTGLFLLFYFIICSVQDTLICMVSDFMQYIGLFGGCIMLLANSPDAEIGFSLLLFGILQGGLFVRMYGQADAMAFLICALYLAAEGMDVERYLEHMAAAVILLGLIQAGRKNISKNGNLKEPVAMLPFITLSFFLVI